METAPTVIYTFLHTLSLPDALPVCNSGVQHQLLEMLDRVGLVAYRLHFLTAAIFRRVGHRMAAIAIGLELEQDRSLARAHPFERHLGRAAHRKHVHAVDLHAGNAKAFAAAIELVLGATAVDRGAHRVLVVLDQDRKSTRLNYSP